MAVACAFVMAQAEASAGYYHSLLGKTGQALKDAVHALTKNHTKLSYSSLWYYYYETDYMPSNRNQVWDMYSNNQYFFGTRGSAVSGMNKEHSFPKSWWGGSSGKDAYSDLYHVIPADAKANSARGNLPFGDVASSDWDNGSAKRGTPRSGQGGGSSKVFEPADEYKGDFARTYFYMVTCYEDKLPTWHANNSDVRPTLDGSKYPGLSAWQLQMLMEWATQDPVSDKETKRNEAVWEIQRNRNPFIDYPGLEQFIWGDKRQVPFRYDDGQSDIDDVERLTLNVERVYDLQGRSINVQRSKKGINIKRGKKYLVE